MPYNPVLLELNVDSSNQLPVLLEMETLGFFLYNPDSCLLSSNAFSSNWPLSHYFFKLLLFINFRFLREKSHAPDAREPWEVHLENVIISQRSAFAFSSSLWTADKPMSMACKHAICGKKVC